MSYRDQVVPEHTMAALRRYELLHIRTGDFLYAVLTNNLKEAFQRADDSNIENMYAIVNYCYNELPSVCWGSPEKVGAWLAKEEV
jgi:hypothetical protein